MAAKSLQSPGRTRRKIFLIIGLLLIIQLACISVDLGIKVVPDDSESGRIEFLVAYRLTEKYVEEAKKANQELTADYIDAGQPPPEKLFPESFDDFDEKPNLSGIPGDNFQMISDTPTEMVASNSARYGPGEELENFGLTIKTDENGWTHYILETKLSEYGDEETLSSIDKMRNQELGPKPPVTPPETEPSNEAGGMMGFMGIFEELGSDVEGAVSLQGWYAQRIFLATGMPQYNYTIQMPGQIQSQTIDNQTAGTLSDDGTTFTLVMNEDYLRTYGPGEHTLRLESVAHPCVAECATGSNRVWDGVSNAGTCACICELGYQANDDGDCITCDEYCKGIDPQSLADLAESAPNKCACRNDKVPTETPPPTATPQPCVDSGARFQAYRGEIEFWRGDQTDEDARFARHEAVLCVGDHVRTAEESTAILVFADLSTFVMGPETEIVLGAMPEQTSNLELVVGKIRTNIIRMMEGQSLDVRTERSICGVEGTDFVVETDSERTTLKVLEGIVDFTSLASSESAQVTAGQSASADSTGLSEVAVFDAVAESALWQEMSQAAIEATEVCPEGMVEAIDGQCVPETTPTTDPNLEKYVDYIEEEPSGLQLPVWIWFIASGGCLLIVGLIILGVVVLRQRKPAAEPTPARQPQVAQVSRPQPSRLPEPFAAVERRYDDLQAKYRSGSIDQATYQTEMKDLVIKDKDGRYWSRTSSGWLWYDGQRWIQGQPPQQ